MIQEQLNKIRNELTSRKLLVTLKHFEEIILQINQKNWEAANGQIRNFLESFFDNLCLILLNKRKTGGEARMALQNAGIIAKPEAEFLFSFMKITHTKGSHPGLSNESETLSRWFACLSFAIFGLSLLPKIVTISDVFIYAKIQIPNVDKISDCIFGLTCPTCEEQQFLSLCTIFEENGETHYQCKNACQDLLIIGKPVEKPIKGRGYRLNEYVLRNANDLNIYTTGGIVQLIKSPSALKKI